MTARRLVLAGAGHAHAQVLLDWLHAPLPGVELVLVSPHAQAPYSGMVPGWLAGRYRDDEIAIDFAALCAACGARWVPDELAAIDPDRGRLTLAGGTTLDFDRLSLNVGSTLTAPVAGAATVLPLRPLAALRESWGRWLQGWRDGASGAPASVLAVGGGAAGFESLLAVLAHLRSLRPDRPLQARLVTSAPRLLDGFAPGAVRAAERALARAGVALHTGSAWAPGDGAAADLLLWATGAEAQAWQRDPARRGTLAVGERGFVRVDEQLRSVSHPNVWAAGDCAEWARPLPKSGVYAVRMGSVLSRNLRAAFGAATAYEPQHRVLALLSTADGRAIAARGGLAVEGRWVWRWKDAIDRRFVARYRVTAAQADAHGRAAGGLR